MVYESGANFANFRIDHRGLLDYLSSLLHFAAAFGFSYFIQSLLNDPTYVSQVDVRNTSGQTPLFLAASFGYCTVFEVLLQNGANCETPEMFGQTPLIAAAFEGEINTVKILINASADLEARDNSGQTPLLVATKSYQTNIIRFLLDSGAEVEARDDRGWNPLLFAVSFGSEKLVGTPKSEIIAPSRRLS